MAETIRLREMTIRYSASRDHDGKPLLTDRTIRCASDIAPALVSLLGEEAVEVFVVVCLSTRARVIGYHVAGRGTIDSASAHPRDVFKAALLANASAVIVAHNHPSGDPAPSRDDRLLTHRLIRAGELLNVPLADHLVVGDRSWLSFRDLELFPAWALYDLGQ